jgi:hypothetical protein
MGYSSGLVCKTTGLALEHAPRASETGGCEDETQITISRTPERTGPSPAEGSAEYPRNRRCPSLNFSRMATAGNKNTAATISGVAIQDGGSNTMTWYKVKLDRQELARYPSQNLIRRLRALMRATGLTGARVFATRQKSGEVCLYISPRALNRRQSASHKQKTADLCLFPGKKHRRVFSPYFLRSAPSTNTTEPR